MKIQTAIRLEESLYEWLKAYCKKNGMTITGLLTKIIIDLKEDKEKGKK